MKKAVENSKKGQKSEEQGFGMEGKKLSLHDYPNPV